MTTNSDLRTLYDEWHSKGPTAWFSDGENERRAIIEVGEPWKGLKVLEIGCGEGDLLNMIHNNGAAICYGVDYSEVATDKAAVKYPHLKMNILGNTTLNSFAPYQRIVLQGVLEHFDYPWKELDYLIKKYLPEGGDIITSSPCFLNPRGMVWMAMATLFHAPMSLTDLHFLHPWEFEKFAEEHPMIESLSITYTDNSWGSGDEMIADFEQRLPKVFPSLEKKCLDKFISYLKHALPYIGKSPGATAIYRLVKKHGPNTV